MRLKIRSDLLGDIEAHVFYFLFENHNFLDQLILKHQLSVTHLVKVRQGCGFGGCRKCISMLYALLANIGIKYLLIDEEIWFDLPSHHRLASRRPIANAKR